MTKFLFESRLIFLRPGKLFNVTVQAISIRVLHIIHIQETDGFHPKRKIMHTNIDRERRDAFAYAWSVLNYNDDRQLKAKGFSGTLTYA